MEPVTFLFSGWEPVMRILFVGIAGYAALVILLRSSRKRTMARMNTFDFVVSVTLGAAFGRVLTTRSVGLVEVLTAFLVLVLLQVAASWLRHRSVRFRALLDGAPTLLYYDGHLLRDAMLRERIVEDDLAAAVRKQGLGSLSDVTAIVLELNGELAVVAERGRTADALLGRFPELSPNVSCEVTSN